MSKEITQHTTMSKAVITSCNGCIFNSEIGLYNDPACIHPLNNGHFLNSIGSYIEEVHFTSESTGKIYVTYDLVIPKTCPLRKVEEIDIGCKIEVKLDEDLFEENFSEL